MVQQKLDDKKLEYFKKLLLKLKAEFEQNISNMIKDQGIQDNDARDISGHVLHMADVATDMYDKEFSLGLASNEREVLHKIDMALKRIEDKSFGICSECSKPIPIARLKAIPYACTCLKCQEKIENEQA